VEHAQRVESLQCAAADAGGSKWSGVINEVQALYVPRRQEAVRRD
jgi:hypothetical protein